MLTTMEMKQKTFKEVTSLATTCLKSKLSRANGTLRYYNWHWRKLKKFMESKGIQFIDAAICKDFLIQEYGNKDFDKLPKRDKDIVKTIIVLIEFMETDTIQSAKVVTDFKRSIGQLMMDYLAFKTSCRLANHTIDEYEQHLNRFLRFLKESNVVSIKDVNQLHILKYIKSINPQKISLAHISIRVLKDFFKYLYNKHVLEIDFSGIMPKDNYKSQAKLPSTYTKEEIETLVAAVDRSNTVGKRDYSIILLGARLGLRASDIANLRFENILWEQNTISLSQFKTKNKIELPLLSEVGNAIVDYLKFGRPKSAEPFVFLCARTPFNSIHSGVVTQIVRHAFAKTSINTKYKRHGPHALRHSLAGRLLECHTTLPVISEVLGHENTESTRFYLRIDLTSLKQCMLEVPAVSPDFYLQKGGFFYE
jgi:site-specific recombinase XerD